MKRNFNLRAASFLLALALTIGTSQAIRRVDAVLPPDVEAETALRRDSPDFTKAILGYTEALERDPANPYRWSDLASVYHVANAPGQARACYKRSLELSGEVPQIWLRAANFHFDLGEYADAMALAAQVLKTVPNYDEVLFSDFDHLLPDPASAMAAIGTNRRALTAYTQHLIDTGNLAASRHYWQIMRASGWNSPAVTASYLNSMLHAHRYAEAQRDWVATAGSQADGFPYKTLIYDGGFEREPTGSPMDWRIDPSAQFETKRDRSAVHSGKWSLKIRFNGQENVRYANVSQAIRVTPGRYLLSAWIRADRVTTDEGIRLELAETEAAEKCVLRTAAVTGTRDWQLISQTVTIPRTLDLMFVRIVRNPSDRFDNKISGVLWLDDISLTPL